MGRPLNKRNFGNTTQSGNQLAVVATVGLSNNAVTTYIIAQKTNTKYIVQGVEGPVLCDVVEDFTGANQMQILANSPTLSNVAVRSLHANRIKTFTGVDIPWDYASPTSTKWQVEGN